MKIPLLSALLAVCIAPCTTAQAPDLYDVDVIREVHLTFAQPNWWQLLLNNYGPEINIPADMRVDGVVYPTVGVRFRGNTSYTQLPPGSEKKSFNIETDAYVPGQDLYGYEHLNLNTEQRVPRPDVPARVPDLLDHASPRTGAEGELRAAAPERRLLGHLHQRPAAEQGHDA